MLAKLLKVVFGSRNDRLLRQYSSKVSSICSLEVSLKNLSDQELKNKTNYFKEKFSNGASLEELLIEAFAVCREAGRRTLNMRHFDVQLIGGMALFDGKISEMRTGEGKTLVATLPAYLASISDRGVHVVTVNDYLAKRDSEWMGKIYEALGLKVGVTLSGMEHKDKKLAYESDITYGTNNEFGFDYLRDNMATEVSERVQRGLFYAIVDEVDSILVDEARTPLIISGHSDDQIDLYEKLNNIPTSLVKQEKEDAEGDYFVDEKLRQVTLSDQGFENSEKILTSKGLLKIGESLYDAKNISLLHHLIASLKANSLFEKDQHYVVQNKKVVIVDEFTGRLMPGRRWSDGLHQAVEAKEGVEIEAENQTLASITFQNYFRMYKKLAGMTGTADTEAYEFKQIYDLETVIIPTHKPMIRNDQQDQIFRTLEEKFEAVVADIVKCNKSNQPVLVGTTSIDNSEKLSKYLNDKKIPHQILNAKQHEKEAEIIAQAGRPGVVTIATNMAGRGTDIVLGGNVESQSLQLENRDDLTENEKEKESLKLKTQWKDLHQKVINAGGLHIIGTERHESRRIDNQLRGRSGRQGDPGSSRFYLAMDDSLLRIFAGEKMKAIMDRLGVPKGEPIEAGMVSRSIESAQRKVENRNFDIRKQLLEFDNVANEQRKIIYSQRNEILESKSIQELVTCLRNGALTSFSQNYLPIDSVEEQWEIKGLEEGLLSKFSISLELSNYINKKEELDVQDLYNYINDKASEIYKNKISTIGEELFFAFEKSVLLQTVDSGWREHLSALDHLRQGIHLRGYAQKDPKQEYKREAFALFERFLEQVRDEVTNILLNVHVETAERITTEIQEESKKSSKRRLNFDHESFEENDKSKNFENDSQRNNLVDSNSKKSTNTSPFKRNLPKVGRNEICPCGSNKKYKHCHGKLS